VTNNYYINSVAGESYGIEHTPERFALNWLRPKTPIPGLWITGQVRGMGWDAIGAEPVVHGADGQ
jgi:phytoene dehydrogenase-like protein